MRRRCQLPTARRPQRASAPCAAPAVQSTASTAAWWWSRSGGLCVLTVALFVAAVNKDRPSSASAHGVPRRGQRSRAASAPGWERQQRGVLHLQRTFSLDGHHQTTSSTAPPPSTVRFDHRGRTDPPIPADLARTTVRRRTVPARPTWCRSSWRSCSCSHRPGGLAAAAPDDDGQRAALSRAQARGADRPGAQLYSSEPGVVSSSPVSSKSEAREDHRPAAEISSLAPSPAGRG